MSLNVKLLRKVQAHILEHPSTVNMETLIREEECGTVGCIAGWTLLLTCPKKAMDLNFDQRWDLAAKKLGIEEGGRGLDYQLFTANGFDHLKIGTKEYAQAVSDRIDGFIEANS